MANSHKEVNEGNKLKIEKLGKIAEAIVSISPIATTGIAIVNEIIAFNADSREMKTGEYEKNQKFLDKVLNDIDFDSTNVDSIIKGLTALSAYISLWLNKDDCDEHLSVALSKFDSGVALLGAVAPDNPMNNHFLQVKKERTKKEKERRKEEEKRTKEKEEQQIRKEKEKLREQKERKKEEERKIKEKEEEKLRKEEEKLKKQEERKKEKERNKKEKEERKESTPRKELIKKVVKQIRKITSTEKTV